MEIGVAPDGRREVQVRFGRETEVADIGDVVGGLLHRPEEERVEHRSQGVVGEGREQLAQLLRIARVFDVEFDAEGLAHRRKPIELLLVRRQVHAVDARHVALLAPAGDRLVGQEHELLDELVGALDAGVLRAPGHVDGRARLLVQDDLRLRELEIQRSALHPARSEHSRQLVRDAQALDHFVRRGLPLRLARQAERARDAAVRELGARSHEAADQPALDRVRRGVELHLGAETKAIYVGQQRAEVRRQRARQHGDGAIGQVHAAPALLRLVVEHAAGRHVRTHVGDRDPGAVAAAGRPLDPHGVVVVAGVLGVDRRQREVPQVLASRLHGLRHLGPVRLRLAHGGLGVRLVDALEDEDLRRLDRELAWPTEDRLDRALRVLLRQLGPARDAHDDGVAVVAAVALGSAAVHGARQHDGPPNARVVGLEPRALALASQRPGHPFEATLEDGDDLSLGATGAPRAHANAYLVAVHGAADGLGRDEDIVARRVEARDEPEAPRVHRQQPLALRPARPRGLGRQLEARAWPRRQHALEAQVVEQPLKPQVVYLRDIEPSGNLPSVQRPRVGAEQVEDLGTGG